MDQLRRILDWNVRIGRLFDVPIHLHITLLFFLFPVLAELKVAPWYALEWSVLIVLSILLHELGHALTAKRYGMTGLSIMLHGFGGFAVSQGYRTPKQALTIVLMGPAVTFAWGILCLGLGYAGLAATPELSDAWKQAWLFRGLGLFNLGLGLLNLIPSLPFDGGNAIRAWLTRTQSDFKATRNVGHLGLVTTIPIILYGFLSGHGLVTIFGALGFISSAAYLMQSGGVRPKEPFEDRKAQKELEALKKREQARTEAFNDDVVKRQIERDEKERLRKLLGE
ncbi:MAG: M50 family metallopeptidase [Fimbriimonas sp.]